MNISKIEKLIGSGDWKAAEDLWMEGIADNPAPDKVREALDLFVQAGKADTAETLGWALLDAHGDADPANVLELAKAALLGAPDSEELRNQACELYKKVHGGSEPFETIWKAAGLDTGQTPRRAIRTLEICMAIRDGAYMGNRFDQRVIRIDRLNALGEYEFQDEGMTESLEPKKLADEFDLLDETDFRVLKASNRDQLAEIVHKDPQAILIGLCQARGGQITSDEIKEELVGPYIPAKKWSNWWSRARTASKKTDKLTLEGRNPVTVVYHPHGRTLEEELADQVAEAYHPQDYLELLRTYYREIEHRGCEVDASFVQPIVDTLATQARDWAANRPAEALRASLSLGAAAALGAPGPEELTPPAPRDILAGMNKPAQAVADIDDPAHWPAALEALKDTEQAADAYETLLRLAPAEQLDTIASTLIDMGRQEAVDEALADTINDPTANLELCLWAWAGPDVPLSDPPATLTVLNKLMQVLLEIDHDQQIDRDTRRLARQRIRSALSANDYQAYCQTLDEIDAGMAGVVKNWIERTDGLAQSCREQMLELLRSKHYSLFRKKKADPWADPTVIWTTQAGLDARQEELRVLTEETMPANAKQIGEAAEEGDLRENADWQAAIEERDMLVSRQRKLNEELAMARVVGPDDVPTDHVGIGSSVTLRRADTGQTLTLTFLGPWQSDPDRQVYAYTTPLAQSVMGKQVGQTVTLKMQGEPADYTIESIACGIPSSTGGGG
jgi:transcription elongation GreA/GreB family factor